MQIKTLAETSVATSSIAFLEGFQQPIQSLALGVVSVIITKLFAWLARKKK